VSFRLDRFEMKFVITRDQREAIMPTLMERMRADENAMEGAYYPIISLYYDTPERDCYWEKEQSVPSRRKMRVRVYGSLDGKLPPTIFVEIKHKCDGRGVKRRLRVPLEEAFWICAGNPPRRPLNVLDMRIVDEIHMLVKKRNFRPTVAMRYDRQAYADKDPESDLRVTFDTGIAYRFDNLEPVPDDRRFERFVLPDGYSVMEVKVTGAVPYWLTKLVGEHHCILQGHSKYNNALEDGDDILHDMMGGRLVKHFYGLTPDSLAAGVPANAISQKPAAVAV
jgi:SPX domain protein involved in polyphosphate accumulation